MAGYGPPRGGGRERYSDYGPPGGPAGGPPPGYGYGYGPGPRGGEYPPPPAAAGNGWGPPPPDMHPRGGQPTQTTLFVAGFPPEMRAADLAYYFERLGPLVRCDIPALRTQQAKPYAFIEYEDPRDARAAHKEMHGVRFGGSAISIQFAKNSPSSKWRFDMPRGAVPPPQSHGSGGSFQNEARRRSPSPRRGAPIDAEDRYRGRDDRGGDRRNGYDRDHRNSRPVREDRTHRQGERARGPEGEAAVSSRDEEQRGAVGEPAGEASLAADVAVKTGAEAPDASGGRTEDPHSGEEAEGVNGSAATADLASAGEATADARPDDENALTPPPTAAVGEDDEDEAEPVEV
ncbi:unnamed protein product [Parajaminaea phylloscopi]